MTIDRVGGAVLGLLALFTLWECRKLPLGTLNNPGPAYVPVLLAALLLFFSVLIVAFGARSARIAAVGWSEWKHGAAILGACAFIALALERLGYRLTIFVALVLLLGVLERQKIVTTILFAAGFSIGSFYLFSTLLRVPLPYSPWGY
jgi:putative tricarboxylic transport membrane protein